MSGLLNRKVTVYSTTKEENPKKAFRIGDKEWAPCTDAVWGYARKQKGNEIEITATEQQNGKETVTRIKPVGGGNSGYSKNQGGQGGGKQPYSKGGGYDNVGQQIGNAITNATSIVVARDGKNASIEAVGVEARNIIILSDQIRKELQEGKLKPKPEEPVYEDDDSDSSFDNNDNNDGGFDDDLPFN